MRKNGSTLPFSPFLFRANINDFQWPQAILAFGGNWLIPKS
jgi:hypothetical protein